MKVWVVYCEGGYGDSGWITAICTSKKNAEKFNEGWFKYKIKEVETDINLYGEISVSG